MAGFQKIDAAWDIHSISCTHYLGSSGTDCDLLVEVHGVHSSASTELRHARDCGPGNLQEMV